MPHPRADPVAPGEESVWDYPRPPRVERDPRRVVIELGGRVIVDTGDVVRVLETSHPPVFYLPISAFVDGALTAASGSPFCEFKGEATYFDVAGGDITAERAGWTYPSPNRGYELLRDRVAVYARAMDRCTVGGIEVEPQPGGFYGGWITPEVKGPFKGEPGTWGW